MRGGSKLLHSTVNSMGARREEKKRQGKMQNYSRGSKEALKVSERGKLIRSDGMAEEGGKKEYCDRRRMVGVGQK